MKNETPETAPLIDVSRLAEALDKFAIERNWGQFHSPKNLAMALMGEVGELAEIFQWMTEEESRSAALRSEKSKVVREELADVLMYLVRLADVLGVDLNNATQCKLRLNAEKYPIEKSMNSSKKYNQL